MSGSDGRLGEVRPSDRGYQPTGKVLVVDDPLRPGRPWRRPLRAGDHGLGLARIIWEAFGSPPDLTFHVEDDPRLAAALSAETDGD